jgi:DNA-binding transcriptional regulator YhcF (GntR family)
MSIQDQDQVPIENLCDMLREKVKKIVKKYRELKVNNEEFQNLVVKELEGLNK